MGDLIDLFGDVPSNQPSAEEQEPGFDWDLEDDPSPLQDDARDSVSSLTKIEDAIWARAFHHAGRKVRAGNDATDEGHRAGLDEHWDPQVRSLAELGLHTHRVLLELLEAWSDADE